MGKLMDNISSAESKLSSHMASTASLAYDFIQYYDDFAFENIKDGTILKDRLKDAIRKVYSNDIQ